MNPYKAETVQTLPVTRWSLVARAGGQSGEAKSRALEELLPLYLPALRAHLMTRLHISSERCEDLLQEFVTQKILERDILASADKGMGRFRTFLLTCLDRFVFNQIRNETTYLSKQKQLSQHLREVKPEVNTDAEAIESFDLAWARQVVAQTLQGMQQQCEAMGYQALWTIFDQRILAPLFRNEPARAYDILARELELTGKKQAANLLVTAKRMYARTLRLVVCQYCDDSEIDQEISELNRILAQGRA